MLEPNVATTMRPRAYGAPKMRAIASATWLSETLVPSRSAFVESLSRQATPSSPSSAKRRTSSRRPSGGDQSTLKSPVCTTTPAGVRSA